jgi:hypothetical protein
MALMFGCERSPPRGRNHDLAKLNRFVAGYDHSSLHRRKPGTNQSRHHLPAEQRICASAQALDCRAHHCVAQPLSKACEGLGEPQSQRPRLFAPCLNSPHAAESSAIQSNVSGQTLRTKTKRGGHHPDCSLGVDAVEKDFVGDPRAILIQNKHRKRKFDPKSQLRCVSAGCHGLFRQHRSLVAFATTSASRPLCPR